MDLQIYFEIKLNEKQEILLSLKTPDSNSYFVLFFCMAVHFNNLQ